MVIATPVHSSTDLKRFIGLPYTLHRDDPNWVPPLRSDARATLTPGRNPFWNHAQRELFLAEHDGRVVGRVAAIVDRNHNDYRKSKTGFFGFFESIDDPDVAAALIEAAASYCRELGMTELYGPANPSLNDEAGLLIGPFDSSPMIKMSYNPEYYIRLLEQQGFVKVKDLYAFIIDINQQLPDKLIRVMESLKQRKGLEVRQADLRNLPRELAIIKEIYNDAWANNWDFAPMTEEELDEMARQLRPILKPELCLLVFRNGEPAAMSIGLPDYNQVLKRMGGRMLPFGWLKFLLGRRRINQTRLWALGVKRKFHNLGYDALLYYQSFVGGRKLGFDWGEVSWILEDNEAIIRPIRMLGGEIYKTYRVYQRSL